RPSVFGGQGLLKRRALPLGIRRVQLEAPPYHLNPVPAPELLQRLFKSSLSYVAPWADHVRPDLYPHRHFPPSGSTSSSQASPVHAAPSSPSITMPGMTGGVSAAAWCFGDAATLG